MFHVSNLKGKAFNWVNSCLDDLENKGLAEIETVKNSTEFQENQKYLVRQFLEEFSLEEINNISKSGLPPGLDVKVLATRVVESSVSRSLPDVDVEAAISMGVPEHADLISCIVIHKLTAEVC